MAHHVGGSTNPRGGLDVLAQMADLELRLMEVTLQLEVEKARKELEEMRASFENSVTATTHQAAVGRSIDTLNSNPQNHVDVEHSPEQKLQSQVVRAFGNPSASTPAAAESVPASTIQNQTQGRYLNPESAVFIPAPRNENRGMLTPSPIEPVQGRQVSDTYTPSSSEDWQRRLVDTMALPRTTMMSFSGDPKQFWVFMRRFNSCVGNTSVDDSAKLNCLFEYCSGKAAAVIQPCALMEPAEGYTRAIKLLTERFGNEYQISEACVRQITEGPPVKGYAAAELQDLADEVSSCSETLRAMGKIGEIDTRSRVAEIVGRLPQYLQNRWRTRAVDKLYQDGGYPGIQDLVKFLQRAARELNDPVFGLSQSGGKDPQSRKQEAVKDSRRFNDGKRQFHRPANTNLTGETQSNQKSETRAQCYLCEREHKLMDCPKWIGAKVAQRWSWAKEKKLCYRCLGKNHIGKDCRKSTRCNVNGCNKVHHFHLHEEAKSNQTQVEKSSHSAFGGNDLPSDACRSKQITVVLRTIPVWIIAPDGNRVLVNALMDEGSDTSYVRRDVVTALGIKGRAENLKIASIASQMELDSQKVDIQIESTDGKTSRRMTVWTLGEMCPRLPVANLNLEKAQYKHLSDLHFPTASGRKTVDILIGSDYPELGISIDERVGNPGEPVARRTPLGWTCVGPMSLAARSHLTNAAYTFHAVSTAGQNESLDDHLRHLWDQDIIHDGEKSKIYTPEEKIVLEKTRDSLRKISGRYEVSIPWREATPDLPDNRYAAERRLRNLETSLKKRPEIADRYKAAFVANIEKGYVTRVPEKRAQEPGWYLPHFAVVREDKQTTKVRIVYDAAAEYEGISLNSRMLPGPKLQREIVEILMRFRMKRVALVGDIKEMFSQVSLSETDRRFHRLLWRDLNPSAPVEVYEATRLVFGDAASPFLAQFVLQHQAEEMQNRFPEAAEAVLESVYVDDVLTGAETDEDTLKLRHDLQSVLGPGGFEVRRWCSNSFAVLEGLDESEQAAGVNLEKSELPMLKSLGCWWNAATDSFTFVMESDAPEVTTKRQLLSRVATIFDPLQFLAPLVIVGKMHLQECWMRGIGWDDDLPLDLKELVKIWNTELMQVGEICINRCYRSRPIQDVDRMSLHVFSDASSLAYGALAYLRFQYHDRDIEVGFIAAKFKVTPLKVVSIPRLELMAALTGVRLATGICRSIGYQLSEATFWTDSQDVIFWIQGQSRHYKTFVANRVSEIHQKTTPSQWRHVPGVLNPADLGTRGMHVEEMSKTNPWYDGPAFLYEGEEAWPGVIPTVTSSKAAEVEFNGKMAITSHVKKVEKVAAILDPNRFSSWTKLCRIVALVIRFIRRLKQRVKNTREDIENHSVDDVIVTPEELKEAEIYWIKIAQQEVFAEDIAQVKKGGCTKGRLKPSVPFLDSEGVMRVTGRLQKSDLPYETKHPAILPPKHRISELIIAKYHRRGRHARGVNATLSDLRTKYWIVHGREEVKRYERSCYRCKIRRKLRAQQIMAPLPDFRLKGTLRCFAHCGVDFGGPFTVRLTRRVSAKRYLCLFTCLKTRAVHLEVAYGLDTASFLNAFSRMVARRGKPEIVVSDNGTNFTAGEKELRSLIEFLDQEKIINQAAEDGIDWHFNPPTGAHHGGIFESMIKVAKKSLTSILNNAGINDEELQSAVVEVEGLLNSRPLWYVGGDDVEEPVLTPNHFLLGMLGGQLAPHVVDEVRYNPRNRWRYVQDIVSKVWKRWMKEYLTLLNTRGKWTIERQDFKVNDVVLMVNQNNPRGKWPLARVTEVFPGTDGHVRVVKVLSGGQEYTRPITSLCPIVSALSSDVPADSS